MVLTAKVVCHVPSDEGPQADILIIEPNGDRYAVRCLCRLNGPVELGEEGDGANLAYLFDRYGLDLVYGIASATVLGRQPGQ